jgi:hypothetical protein
MTLPRPTLPRPTSPRPAAAQVPAAAPVVAKSARQSAFVTGLIEYVATDEQSKLQHGLAPSQDDEHALPEFLLDESLITPMPEPEAEEPPWDEPFATGVAPSELVMREYAPLPRPHGRPTPQPPADLPYGQRPPRPAT